jgi:metal-responsive CopG/Arc/MetJ family transcriptional regulator
MARFNITLPDFIAEKLDEEAKRQDVARSTLIAHYIEEYYEGESEADIEAELQQLRTRSADSTRRDERVKWVEKLIAEQEAEMQQVRAAYEEQVQQIKADSAARTQHVEEELRRLETVTQKLDNDLKASEEHLESVAEKLRQSESSRDTAVTGLQRELELVQQKVANLETSLPSERDPSVPPVSDFDVRPSHPIKKLEDLGPIIDHRPRVGQPPTAEPEPQPTAEPEPQPTAEPSPSVPPVSDIDVRSSRPMGDILNVPTDAEPSHIEPPPNVTVIRDTDVRPMKEDRVMGKDDRIVLERGLFKSRAPREKQA